MAAATVLAAACTGGSSGDATTTSASAPPSTFAPAPATRFVRDVPLDPASPWPKFRADARQSGFTPVDGLDRGGEPWVVQTGKGIFSTPVIDGDGTVYVGSADQEFRAVDREGKVRWSVRTGEIIDSAALLDDRGRVYVGSGDGNLYALDRATGAEVWRFAADPASATGAFINWFEGNVAIGADGTLYAPNDNFCTYAIERDAGTKRWCFTTQDQTWSLPAVDVATNRLFLGSNFPLAANVFALDAATGSPVWSAQGQGSMVASPLLSTPGTGGLVILGGFDGIVRALDPATGAERWTFAARDHVYASAAQGPDGTVVVPSADGTIYGLDPATGAQRWAYDTLEPIRSSPAIDAAGRIYVGSGEGKLFVLEPDGSLRWSIRLIDEARNDLNASPALGPYGVVIGGENGGIFFVPYDYCRRDAARRDQRCRLGPGEDLPTDGALLAYTDRFGKIHLDPPDTIEANQPLAFSLLVRSGGETRLAVLDSPTVEVIADPERTLAVDTSGDRRYITVIPEQLWAGPAGGEVSIRVQATYLEGLTRDGGRLTGGSPSRSVDATFRFAVAPYDAGAPFPFPVPPAPGQPGGTVELRRIAAPLPTILPSYNQIGFDSIHYLLGMVEGGTPPSAGPAASATSSTVPGTPGSSGTAVAWAVGGRLGPDGDAVVDPTSTVRFPLVVAADGPLVTLENRQGFTISFNNFPLPFQLFRVATRLTAPAGQHDDGWLDAKAICGEITFYGPFLQLLGYCNPTTDLLDVFGAAQVVVREPASAPPGVGTVAFGAAPGLVRATLEGSALPAGTHNLGILLVDAATGLPVPLAYADATTVANTPAGTVGEVTLALPADLGPTDVRAYLMVDTTPAATTTLRIGG